MENRKNVLDNCLMSKQLILFFTCFHCGSSGPPNFFFLGVVDFGRPVPTARE